MLAGPVAAIALAACSVLVHCAVVNMAALRLAPEERTWSRFTSGLGLLLCIGFAALLPTRQVVITAVALALGWTLCTLLGRGRSPASG